MEGQVNYLNFITRGSVLGFSFIISKSSKEVLFPKTAKRPLSYSVQQSKKNQSPRIKKFSINVIPQIIFSTFHSIAFSLTVPVPCISESCVKIKINLNFYFHTSLWCLKRFYEGFNSLLIKQIFNFPRSISLAIVILTQTGQHSRKMIFK